jgi:porin
VKGLRTTALALALAAAGATPQRAQAVDGPAGDLPFAAQDAPVATLADTPAPSGYLAGSYATGDWGGLRPALAARGVDIGLVYTADFGQTSATDEAMVSYLALLDGWVDLDTGKLGLWGKGRLFVGGQHAHSRGQEGGMEPFQAGSNIDTPAFTQLGECFFEQRLLGDNLWIRVGKQDTNRDFGSPRYPGNFVNNAYGALPTIPMPSHPTPAVGFMMGADVTSHVHVRAGAFEGQPEYGGWGFDTATDPGRGFFSVAAVELITSEASGERQTGRHTLGGWYHSADALRAEPEHQGPLPSNQGAFLTLDQRFYRGEGGTHLFGRGAVTRAGQGQASAYAAGGVAYHAPFASRTDDTVGLGVSTVWLEQPTGLRAESFVELFYKARFTKFFSLQPDLQLFRHPQGGPDHGWAVTLRGRVKL